jgi:hypothetical protein
MEREMAASDDELWRELRAIVPQVDPVPPEVLQASRESYTWRTIDAELAVLAYDSVVDRSTCRAVCTSEGSRLLIFEASELIIEVEVVTVGSRRRLVGRLDPPQRARVEVRHRGSTIVVEADRAGRFRADDVLAGPSSLRCSLVRAKGKTSVVTDCVML